MLLHMQENLALLGYERLGGNKLSPVLFHIWLLCWRAIHSAWQTSGICTVGCGMTRNTVTDKHRHQRQSATECIVCVCVCVCVRACVRMRAKILTCVCVCGLEVNVCDACVYSLAPPPAKPIVAIESNFAIILVTFCFFVSHDHTWNGVFQLKLDTPRKIIFMKHTQTQHLFSWRTQLDWTMS